MELWENSTLMAYISPFSGCHLLSLKPARSPIVPSSLFSAGPSGTVPSLRALSHFEEHFKTWSASSPGHHGAHAQLCLHSLCRRESALASYWEQLGFLERVWHEVLLLHGRLQSQDEVIGELGRQLRQARQERALLQQEFEQYRTHVQVPVLRCTL